MKHTGSLRKEISYASSHLVAGKPQKVSDSLIRAVITGLSISKTMIVAGVWATIATVLTQGTAILRSADSQLDSLSKPLAHTSLDSIYL